MYQMPGFAQGGMLAVGIDSHFIEAIGFHLFGEALTFFICGDRHWSAPVSVTLDCVCTQNETVISPHLQPPKRFSHCRISCICALQNTSTTIEKHPAIPKNNSILVVVGNWVPVKHQCSCIDVPSRDVAWGSAWNCEDYRSSKSF